MNRHGKAADREHRVCAESVARYQGMPLIDLKNHFLVSSLNASASTHAAPSPVEQEQLQIATAHITIHPKEHMYAGMYACTPAHICTCTILRFAFHFNCPGLIVSSEAP